MKCLFFILILSVLIFSCKGAPDRSAVFLEPRADMKLLLDSFVKINGSCYAEYAVYIDKRSPHEYDLLLYAGDTPLTKNEDQLNTQLSLQQIRVSGVEFKMYSGAEHYFRNTSDSETKSKSSLKKDGQIFWAVKDSSNVRTVYEVDGAYPFLPLPGKCPEGVKSVLPVEGAALN